MSRSIQIFIVDGVRDIIKRRPDWFHKSFINELTAQFWLRFLSKQSVSPLIPECGMTIVLLPVKNFRVA